MRVAGLPTSVPTPARRGGFTLIEIMVAVSIMIVLTVLGGMALAGRGGEGAALAGAQGIVAGMVESARAQAALTQGNARLIVYGQQPPGTNVDSNKYLRALQVVRQETQANGSTVWVAAGDYVVLPVPVCVVPPSPVPANHLRSGVAWTQNAATGPVSTLTVLTSFNYVGQSPTAGRTSTAQFFGVQGQSGRILYLEFAPDGSVVSNTSGNPTKIALATAQLTPNALPLFNNANGVRGLFVRKTGSVSLVDDANSF
jgi:type II secretory pathway pseudopilin PulG